MVSIPGIAMIGGGADPPEVSASNYHVYKLIEDFLSAREIEKGLEIGCGYGRVTPYLGEFCDETYAIEPNREMLAEARKYYNSVNFKEAKAQDLPFDDNSFDLVFAKSVLQHIPDNEIEPAISEIQRVLKNDGILLLMEDTDGGSPAADAYNIRSVERYEEFFPDLELEEVRDANFHWREANYPKSAMLFETK